MAITVGIHPESYEVEFFAANDSSGPFVTIDAYEDKGKVTVFLRTPADCDELIKAAVAAKDLLLGGTSAPAPTLAGTRDWPGEPPDATTETTAAALAAHAPDGAQ